MWIRISGFTGVVHNFWRIFGYKSNKMRQRFEQQLVLATVRHTLNTNWDRLEHIANHDNLISKILGVHTSNFGEDDYEFAYQTIIDNVSLIDEQMLFTINEIVVKHGQVLLKKKLKKNLS